jgi:molybdopterin synthase catalytic subunit
MMQPFETLTFEPINIPVLLASLRSPLTGGIVMFSGEVRNINKGREVSFLEYEAYESMARKKIKGIVDFATHKWQLNHALCVHRLGRLEITDCAVLVLTASMHRAQAYEANRYIIDMVKRDVPIWKKEHYTDGTFEWGNNSDCSCVLETHPLQ